MLDGLLSFSIILLAAGFLLPIYTGMIIQKADLMREEEAIGRLFEGLQAFQYLGEPLITGERRMNGDLYTFHLKGDVYCVDYAASGKKEKSLCERIPGR
ncbi:hypothetical protein AC622_05575 [Bacillus sp. FJAT-27916]|uniref:hypothetical protein n=1 Tax=Pradoshia sp. TaxID=2651281 RepID=UPI0006713CB5|nr:hypothetical protein AC622_05575 [Bacillus sp. FJAT-27916]